jgi:hypothetical protein
VTVTSHRNLSAQTGTVTARTVIDGTTRMRLLFQSCTSFLPWCKEAASAANYLAFDRKVQVWQRLWCLTRYARALKDRRFAARSYQ